MATRARSAAAKPASGTPAAQADEPERPGAAPSKRGVSGRRRGADASDITHDQLDPRLQTVVALVPALAETMGDSCEVVVHDLSRAPNSIVAIAGTLTGRRVGGPMTDLLLSVVVRGETENMINYRTEAAGGRIMRSSTIFIKDDKGVPVGCLCINMDVTAWTDLAELAAWNLGTTVGSGGLARVAADVGPRSGHLEAFPSDMEGLREALVSRAIDEVDIPLNLMQKQHKMRVVQALDANGFFLMKESVGYLARALGVTRYSIYNYLNEVRQNAD